MNVDDIISRIRRGEDSVTQFKRQAIGVSKLADEMVAFANAEGGVILFGVDDDGMVVGLDGEQKKLNMFMHRDYFVESPWRVFIFDDRIEIISPGCLPNHLTIEKMKSGVSCARNATIASFASKELPYRGLGTGVKRAVEVVPDIQFESDRDANWLKAVVRRTNTSKDADSKGSDQNQSKTGPKLAQNQPKNIDSLSPIAREVYLLIREDQRTTYRGISAKLEVAKDTVRLAIGTLVKNGLIRRVGPKNGGRWEVIG